MGLFQNKWAGEILLETKRIFGLDHDASEQEVHEHLRNVESYDTVVDNAKSEGMQDLLALQSGLAETERQKDFLENRAKELESQVDALQANVDALKTEAEALKADVTAKAAEIEALKSEPAAKHTTGDVDPEPAPKSATPVWDAFKAQHGLQ